MTKLEFLARIANTSKNSTAYKLAVEIATKNDIIRTCHSVGSGRFTSNSDNTEKVAQLLTLANIDFVIGNDAPRGGKTGNYIALTAFGKKQVAELRHEMYEVELLQKEKVKL